MSAPAEVSVAAYGAVLGAVAGGASLELALADAGIDARAWPDADARWAAAIVDDEAIAEDFERAFVEARDARYRPPPPLDEIDAYVGFVEALARAESPVAWAAAKGLTIDDLALVQAHWTARMRARPELGDVLRERLQVALPEPQLVASPRPASAAPAARPAATIDDANDDDDDAEDGSAVDEPAPLPDVLADAMPEPAPVLAPSPPGASARSSAPPRPPRHGDVAADPLPAVVVERVLPSFMRVQPGSSPPPSIAPGPPPIAPGQLPGVALPPIAPGPPPGVALPPIAPGPPPGVASPPSFVRSRLGATMMGVSLPVRPATPFEPTPPTQGATSAGGTPPAAVTGTVVASADAGQLSPDERAGLERYAAICADLAAKAEPRPAILARYGLDESSKKALDQRWEQLFQTNGTARVVWMEALAAHRRAGGAR